MRESVPTARYSPVCNVLRQWETSLILTYRVYRLYDLELRFSSAFFDDRVFNPYAASDRQPLIVKARPTMLAFRLYSYFRCRPYVVHVPLTRNAQSYVRTSGRPVEVQWSIH